MDKIRVIQRITTAQQAFDTLQELVIITNPSDVERDATIQRFEYTKEYNNMPCFYKSGLGQ